jgi:hypothetical protein
MRGDRNFAQKVGNIIHLSSVVSFLGFRKCETRKKGKKGKKEVFELKMSDIWIKK